MKALLIIIMFNGYHGAVATTTTPLATMQACQEAAIQVEVRFGKSSAVDPKPNYLRVECIPVQP